MKQVPQVQDFMTAVPHTVGKHILIKQAFAMMRQYHIRHLPVQDGGKLVGVLTDRDVKLVASFSDALSLSVEEVMTPDPYAVLPETDLGSVANEMAKHKYGCAVVQTASGKVVGIFTATDGMRVLAEVLQSERQKAA